MSDHVASVDHDMLEAQLPADFERDPPPEPKRSRSVGPEDEDEVAEVPADSANKVSVKTPLRRSGAMAPILVALAYGVCNRLLAMHMTSHDPVRLWRRAVRLSCACAGIVCL